ncbi:hypothetical protein CEXT_243761 [Caerostris extrusa]|uniref:Uncharacterized protein n=1 Tax=Caerostris extrusa TaxID=172846 RepID=A0AAV4NZJ4_CAEEX|nr:hypothetical protein CEXT_243761 [Caerostris extrusa]
MRLGMFFQTTAQNFYTSPGPIRHGRPIWDKKKGIGHFRKYRTLNLEGIEAPLAGYSHIKLERRIIIIIKKNEIEIGASVCLLLFCFLSLFPLDHFAFVRHVLIHLCGKEGRGTWLFCTESLFLGVSNDGGLFFKFNGGMARIDD